MSVIVPTHNRPERLRATLRQLDQQHGLERSDYELIVVDDGSVPPTALDAHDADRAARLIRLEGEGSSSARNAGAEVARGELLVFLDDDMSVEPTFLAGHWSAHGEWPGALQVGLNRLPKGAMPEPFVRFRQRLEHEFLPEAAGPIAARNGVNYCPAANMAIERSAFHRLGGFDPDLAAGEDQDLGLRHARGGAALVFVPAALAVHHDDGRTLESYSRRAERYMEDLVGFGARHPGRADTAIRGRVNGPIQWGAEPVSLSARKLLKSILIWPAFHELGLAVTRLVERIAPDSRLLDALYRVHLGAHLQRGYRRGLRSASA